MGYEAAKEQEVHHPTEGLLVALHDVAKEVDAVQGFRIQPFSVLRFRAEAVG